jgi:hypothetical protein
MAFVLQVLGSIGGATAILYVLSKYLVMSGRTGSPNRQCIL